MCLEEDVRPPRLTCFCLWKSECQQQRLFTLGLGGERGSCMPGNGWPLAPSHLGQRNATYHVRDAPFASDICDVFSSAQDDWAPANHCVGHRHSGHCRRLCVRMAVVDAAQGPPRLTRLRRYLVVPLGIAAVVRAGELLAHDSVEQRAFPLETLRERVARRCNGARLTIGHHRWACAGG